MVKLRILLLLVVVLISFPDVLSVPTTSSFSLGVYTLSSPAVVDVDGDGSMEIIIGDLDGRVHVLNSNGSEIAGWPIDLGTAHVDSKSPAVGDLDGDGNLEIVTFIIKHAGGFEIRAWHRNGSSFWNPDNYYISLSNKTTFPSIADLDNNGRLELAVGSTSEKKLYLLQYNGSLDRKINLEDEISSTPTIGDIDRDGALEVVTVLDNGKLQPWKLDSTTLWDSSVSSLDYVSPVMGDIDFDGKLEVVIASSSGLYAIDDDGSELWNNTDITYGSFLALADLNGDNELDVIGGTSVYPNIIIFAVHGRNGSMIWPPKTLRSLGPIAYERVVSAPVIADIDDDGGLEVLISTSITFGGLDSGKLYALDSEGNEEWSMDIGNLYTSSVGSSPAIGDVDGDNSMEAIVASYNGTIWIIELTGTTNGKDIPWASLQQDEKNTGVYSLPLTKISSPNNGSSFNENDSIQFSAQGYTVDGNEPSFNWTSSKDGWLGVGSSINKSCLSVGDHEIIHTAEDSEGRSTSYSRTIIISNLPPSATLTALGKTVFQVNETVPLSGVGTDSCSTIDNYEWSSNVDGVLAVVSSLNISNLSVGNHTITFKVLDDSNAIATENVNIMINDHPIASIDFPVNGSIFNLSDVISFSGTGSDSDGVIELYEWDFDGDDEFDWSSATTGNTTYNYATGVNYTARLRVTDNYGATNIAELSLVLNHPPNVWINSPTEIEFKVGQQVPFEGGAFDNDGTVVSYNWTSSLDGMLNASASFNTSSLSIGDHIITFSAKDNYGSAKQITKSLRIKPLEAPDANISSPSEGGVFSSGEIIFFNGSGEDLDGTIVSHNWTSNVQGFLSNLSNFSRPLSCGTHTITLTVTDDDSKTGSKQINLFISCPSTGKSGSGSAPPSIETKDEAELMLRLSPTTNFYVAPPKTISVLTGPLLALGEFPLNPDKAVETSKLVKKKIGSLEGDVYSIVSQQVLKKYKKSQKVVIARGDLEVDSLASVAFAKVLGIPILLVEPDRMPKVTGSVMEELEVESVFVVGGPIAVSEDVAQLLPKTERIWGNNREETAVKIAEALMAQTTINSVVITDGQNPDPLAAVAAVQFSAPIVYVNGGEIPPATKAFLKEHKLRIQTVGVSSEAIEELQLLVS